MATTNCEAASHLSWPHLPQINKRSFVAHVVDEPANLPQIGRAEASSTEIPHPALRLPEGNSILNSREREQATSLNNLPRINQGSEVWTFIPNLRLTLHAGDDVGGSLTGLRRFVNSTRRRTRRLGVRISQGAPHILESDICSEMNLWCFTSIPSNNRPF